MARAAPRRPGDARVRRRFALGQVRQDAALGQNAVEAGIEARKGAQDVLAEEAERDQADFDVEFERLDGLAEQAAQAARRNRTVLRIPGSGNARQIGQPGQQHLQRARQAFGQALDEALQGHRLFLLVLVHQAQRSGLDASLRCRVAGNQQDVGRVEEAGLHLHPLAAQHPQRVEVDLLLRTRAAAPGEVEKVRVQFVQQIVKRLRQMLLDLLAQARREDGASVGDGHLALSSAVPVAASALAREHDRDALVDAIDPIRIRRDERGAKCSARGAAVVVVRRLRRSPDSPRPAAAGPVAQRLPGGRTAQDFDKSGVEGQGRNP